MGYSYMITKADCEFCTRHRSDVCDMKPNCLEGGDANDFDLGQKCTLADIYNSMKHERKLVIGVIFKPNSKVNHELFMDKRKKQDADDYFAGKDDENKMTSKKKS